MGLHIINLDRWPYTLPGGQGHEDDRAVVIDDARTEPHPITGAAQSLRVYTGTLSGAIGFMQRAELAGPQ